MRGLLETYDDTCNVVEPVIKDVIVTEEYHELCSLTRRWPFIISSVAIVLSYRFWMDSLIALKTLSIMYRRYNVAVNSQREQLLIDWIKKKKKKNRWKDFVFDSLHWYIYALWCYIGRRLTLMRNRFSKDRLRRLKVLVGIYLLWTI